MLLVAEPRGPFETQDRATIETLTILRNRAFEPVSDVVWAKGLEDAQRETLRAAEAAQAAARPVVGRLWE